jgi:hypothetical protein
VIVVGQSVEPTLPRTARLGFFAPHTQALIAGAAQRLCCDGPQPRGITYTETSILLASNRRAEHLNFKRPRLG